MSRLMGPQHDAFAAGPSSLRGGSGGIGGGAKTGQLHMAQSSQRSPQLAGPGATASSASLPPWTQQQPSVEELTLYTTLSAYADALDALPLDLTRSFSDLRELDAVLGPHLNSLTSRLDQLTAVIEDDNYTPGERLLALKEVAEEARAYKMGGEDKIRVALNTAETIISHTTYIDSLLSNLASVSSLASILSPPTHSHLAGHLSDGTALAPGSGPGGNNPANADAYVESASPAKKKRPGQGAQSGANLAATAVSAAEKRANDAHASGQASTAGGAAGSAAQKKRKTAAQSSSAKARANAHDDHDGAHAVKKAAAKRPKASANGAIGNGAATGASSTDKDDDGRGGNDAGLSSTSRSRGGRGGRAAAAAAANIRGSGSDDDDDMSDPGSTAPRPARVARAPRPGTLANSAAANASADDGASTTPTAVGAEDADERRYCFCNNISYGDMIGCDGDDCEREWFHLDCVGLLKPPQGTWYCDDCAQKRASRTKKSKTKLAKTSGAHGGGVLETKSRTASAKR